MLGLLTEGTGVVDSDVTCDGGSASHQSAKPATNHHCDNGQKDKENNNNNNQNQINKEINV